MAMGSDSSTCRGAVPATADPDGGAAALRFGLDHTFFASIRQVSVSTRQLGLIRDDSRFRQLPVPIDLDRARFTPVGQPLVVAPPQLLFVDIVLLIGAAI
jgi:hypothetical protein